VGVPFCEFSLSLLLPLTGATPEPVGGRRAAVDPGEASSLDFFSLAEAMGTHL